MFRTDLLPIIRILYTVYTGIGIFHASYVDYLIARSGSGWHVLILTSLSDNVETPDDGQ